MSAVEQKKIIILRILQILEKYSSANSPLTQAQIIEYLKKDYCLDSERKAVGRSITALKDAGYGIKCVKEGSFIEQRLFDLEETRILTESIFANPNISSSTSNKLISAVSGVGADSGLNTDCFFYVKSAPKEDKFDVLATVCKAIKDRKKLECCNNSIGTDKKPHKVGEKISISVYRIIVQGRLYYLAANTEGSDGLTFLRLELLSDIKLTNCAVKPLKTLAGYENGADWNSYVFTESIPTSEASVRVVIEGEKAILNDLYDSFGTDFTVESIPNGRIRIGVVAKPTALLKWVFTQKENVEVISPTFIRQAIVEKLNAMREVYRYDNCY